MPAILYDVKSRGAEAYLALAREVLARGDTPAPAQGAPAWLINVRHSAAG